MGRFDDLLSAAPAATRPGRFDDLIDGQAQQAAGRFDDLLKVPKDQQQPWRGLLFDPDFRRKTVGFFGGAVGKVIQLLSATQQATTGITEKGLEETGILKETSIAGIGAAAGIREQKSFIGTLKRIGEEKFPIVTDEMIRGFDERIAQAPSGEEVSALERAKAMALQVKAGGLLVGRYEPTQSVWGNFVRELPVTALGLTGDIFADPFVALGKIGAIGKATSAIGELLTNAYRAAATRIPAAQAVGDLIGRAFVTRWGQRQVFANLDRQRKIEESFGYDTVGKLVDEVIERPLAMQQRIAQVVKGGITTDDEVRSLAQPIRDELDRLGQEISDINPKLLKPEVFAANRGEYFPRLYAKHEFPSEEEMLGSYFASPRAVSIPRERFKARYTDEEFAKMRLKQLPLDEVQKLYPNAVSSDGKMYIGKVPVKDIPRLAQEMRDSLGEIKEAGLPAAKGLTQLEVTAARERFYKDIAKIASEEPKPGWVQLADDPVLGDLAGKFLPAAEYAAVAGVRQGKVASEFDRLWSDGLRLWKTMKTAYNPATISRNDLTNYLILNPLGGVGPHRIDIYAKTVNEMYTNGPLYQMAKREGLELSTFQAAELRSRATETYAKLLAEGKGVFASAFAELFPTVKAFHRKVVNFYGSQDKFFKLANFIKGMTEDGMTPGQAMRRANFYLVDYSEVPELVEWARKSPVGVPFISFAYGVSKPLAKTLLERPDRLAAYGKILSAIQEMNPQYETLADRQREIDVLPEWIANGTYFRLPMKDRYGRGQYLNLTYILPTNIIEAKSILPSNPVFTTLSSLILNRNGFTKKEIWKETDTREERLRKEALYIWQQIVPSLAPFGYSFEKIRALLQHRPEPYTGYVREALTVFADVLAGIKVQPVDPTVEASMRARERQKEIEALRTELRRAVLDKALFPEEREKEVQRLQGKIQRRAAE